MNAGLITANGSQQRIAELLESTAAHRDVTHFTDRKRPFAFHYQGYYVSPPRGATFLARYAHPLRRPRDHGNS